eukprot:Lankesteria_metandrocarpae@DN848_c0_g1_i1.p1
MSDLGDCDVQMTPSASSSSGNCSPLDGASDNESRPENDTAIMRTASLMGTGATALVTESTHSHTSTIRSRDNEVHGVVITQSAVNTSHSDNEVVQGSAAVESQYGSNTESDEDGGAPSSDCQSTTSAMKDDKQQQHTQTSVAISNDSAAATNEYLFKTWPPTTKGLALSVVHSVGCLRGELYLSELELTELHKYLRDCGALPHFQFVSPEKTAIDKRHSTAMGAGRMLPVGPKPKCAPVLAVQQMYSASSGAACVARPSVEVPKIKSNPAAVKRLVSWAQRFHRAITCLCKQESCKSFVDEVNFHGHLLASHGKDGKINKPSYSMDLRTVLSKLEQGLYTRQVDVFNDVYCVWLSAYRAYDPGSPMWMSAHDASTLFAEQIALHPLRDDFHPSSPPSHVASVKTPKLSKLSAADNSSESVDRILQQIMGHQTTSSTPARKAAARTSLNSDANTGAVAGGSTNTFGNGKGKKSPRASKKPKTTNSVPVNTTELESMIKALLPEQQLQLYSEFRTSACWTESSDGCISLNQDSTSNAAFAKMLLWCKKKLNITPTTSANPHGTAGTESAVSAWRKRSAALQQNTTGTAGMFAAKRLKSDGEPGAAAQDLNQLDSNVGIYSQALSSSSLSSSSSSDSSTDSDVSDDSGGADQRWGAV